MFFRFTGNHTSYQVHNYGHESSTICKKNFEHFSWHPHQFLLPHSFQNGACLRIVGQKKNFAVFAGSWVHDHYSYIFLLHMTIFLEAKHGLNPPLVYQGVDRSPGTWRPTDGNRGPWSMARVLPKRNLACTESSEWELITWTILRGSMILCPLVAAPVSSPRFSVKSQTAFGHLCHKTMQLCVFRQPFVFF